MGADELEVLPELPEVLVERGAVGHHLLGGLLDLEPLEAHYDHLEIRGERRRRDREDSALVRVSQQLPRLARDELVVDRFGGQVHQREVVRAFGGENVLPGNVVDVLLHVAAERLLVQLALRVVFGGDHQLEVVERELRVDRDQPVDPDHRVDAVTGREGVLHRVGVRGEPVSEEVLEQQLAEAAPRLGRPQGLLEPREILRAGDHRLCPLGHLAETLIDFRRRLRRRCEPAVDLRVEVREARAERLLHPLQPQLDLGVACRELAPQQARQENRRRAEGEEDETGERSDDHGAQKARDPVGRTKKTPAPTNP